VIFAVSLAVADFTARNAIPCDDRMEIKRSGQPPAAAIFRSLADPNDLATLIRDSKLLSTDFLTARLAVVVKKVQSLVTIAHSILGL
jgi:hypothetical protein